MTSIIYSLPYIALFLFLCGFAIPVTTGKNRLMNTYWQRYAFFACLIAFVGLRGFIFTDWKNYYSFYEAAPTLFDGTEAIVTFLSKSRYAVFEKGFSLFSILIKTISDNYFFYQFVSFSIDVVILYAFFKMYVPNAVLLAFVFFYVFNGVIGQGIQINFLRNAKAMMLFLISLPYLQKRKYAVYVLLNIIGAFFHISSILYIPLCFILRKRFSRLFYIAIFIMGNAIYLLQIRYISVLLKSASVIAGGQIAYIINRYIDNSKWNTSYGISIGYFERVFTYILVLCFSKRLYKKDCNIVFINCLFLYVLLYLYFSEMKILTDRLPLLFAFSYWVIYPQIYSFLSKNNKLLFWGIFILYATLKIANGHRSILNLYDNALFLNYSFQERLSNLNKYMRSLPK